jgi:hypothetical protein
MSGAYVEPLPSDLLTKGVELAHLPTTICRSAVAREIPSDTWKIRMANYNASGDISLTRAVNSTADSN